MPSPRAVIFALILAGSAALATLSVSGAAPMRPASVRATTASPIVVELYHSQGCSSCPPAEADLNALADRPDVLALSFAVTYWDRLGWTDTFGQARFTQRQLDYAHAGQGEVATPEFIVNGARAVVGADRRALDAAVAQAGSPGPGPAITASANHISVAAGMPATATVWLVRYDPRTLNVPVRAGENAGRTLPNRNVVRDLVRLGEWNGTAATYAVPAAPDAALRAAVLVQRGHGGPIIAARRF
jgi:hypothetical protein